MLDTILLTAPPLMLAVILHEIAHGYVAYRLGDPTAKIAGRLTLNPISHIDPFMTIILPTLLVMSGSPIVFGGAKPIPVDSRYFRNPRREMVLVAIAGPLTNITLAAISSLLLHQLYKSPPTFLNTTILGLTAAWLHLSILINLVLAAFNMIPVPPLDGGRVAVGLLPDTLAYPLAKLEKYGLLILVALLYSGLVDKVLTPILEFADSFLLP